MTNKKLLACNATLLNQEEIVFDSNNFIQRLLLFDEYILDSIRLKEIPYIIKLIGYEGFLLLLEQDFFKLRVEANSIGQTGQFFERRNQNKKILPPLCFSFNILKSIEKEYISSCLKNIHSIETINKKEQKKLKLSIVDNLVKSPNNFGNKTIEQIGININETKYMTNIILEKLLNKNYGITDTKNINLNIEELDKGDFHVEHNLEKLFNLKQNESHKIIEQSMLAMLGMHLRIEEMDVFDSISGFKPDESELFDKKIERIYNISSSYQDEQNFNRFREIYKFPKLEIDKTITIDIEKLLKIRDSKDCIEFREWIAKIDNYSDNEIDEQLNNYKSKLINLATTTEGKSLRFLVGTVLVGAVASPPVGMIVGAIDTFMIDRLLPRKGYLSFIHNDFNTIFKI